MEKIKTEFEHYPIGTKFSDTVNECEETIVDILFFYVGSGIVYCIESIPNKVINKEYNKQNYGGIRNVDSKEQESLIKCGERILINNEN